MRKLTSSPSPSPDTGVHTHIHDVGFDEYLARIKSHVAEILSSGYRLFTTDATGLFDLYLSKIPKVDRQYHNCNACRTFFERFGGLVVLEGNGDLYSPIWAAPNCPKYYHKAISAVYEVVVKATVTGVFLSDKRVLGLPVTGKWTHYSIALPSSHVHTSKVKTPDQAMAEKLEDYKNVRRAVGEVSEDALQAVVTLLGAEALYRGEKILGPVKWLSERQQEAKTTKNRKTRDNLMWRAVAEAPAGFCHPRSSVAWSLIEDIASGLSVEDAKRKFTAKMQGDIYQRPQTAPSSGTIARAEVLFQQLGLAPALERRFARLEEVELVWTSSEPTHGTKRGGVFAHLKAKDSTEVSKDLGTNSDKFTWEKFSRLILPETRKLEFHVPYSGRFVGMVTAVHPEAPPILKWDREDRRNPVSQYTYISETLPYQWNLNTGKWATVTGISSNPAHWQDNTGHAEGEFRILILEGAKDSGIRECALFPEIIRSDLHEVRSVIEAYSKRGQITGYAEASACGYSVNKGMKPIQLRVTNAQNQTMIYTVDRWD